AMESIIAYKRIKKIFIPYNVILPSASSERLFSKSKLLCEGQDKTAPSSSK
ncbi:Hypothetical protein FKW44_013412, partial [Caligus rogercresseyi]